MNNRTQGFTLLEILIALFIFTIVSIITTHTLYSLLNTQAILEKKSQRLTALETALLLLSNDLSQTINRPVINGNGILNFFVGGRHNIIFTHGGLTNPLSQLQRTTLQRTEYILDDKQHLVRMIWPVLDQTKQTPTISRILLENVNDVDFEYLDKQGHFHDKWVMKNDNDPLPTAVQITVEIAHWGTLQQLFIIPAHVSPKTISSNQEQ